MTRSQKGRALARLITQLLRANTVLLRVGDELIASLGLTSALWQVLAVVALSRISLTAPQIAKHLGLTRQGVQNHLHALVDLGYLWPSHNKAHKRSPVYRLTDSGQKAFTSAERSQTRWLNDLAEGLTEQGLLAAVEVIRQVLVKVNSGNSK
jgi:DNA-binding MarR family transcriptional regulator